MKTIAPLLFFISLSSIGWAQHVRFISSGIITFEKRANMYALFKKQIKDEHRAISLDLFDRYAKNNPQFKTINSSLKFSNNKSLYTPEETISDSNFPAFSQNNMVFADFSTKEYYALKRIFEKSFIINDTLRKIRWKITDETREIAGYECVRANAMIMDSLYLVAFYTDEIITPGGPESFTGLPGMILGVALPHEHITWFAKKVTDTHITPTELMPPNNNSKMNETTFKNNLKDLLKGYEGLLSALKFYLL